VIENSYLRFLSKGSIFSLIPGALEELSPFMEIIFARPGKSIYKAGDLLDSLVIPLQEPLSLVANEKILMLQKGRALSLSSLLRNLPLPYDVESEEFNKLLVLPRQHLMDYFERNKDVLSYLLLMTECESFRRIKHVLSEKGCPQHQLIQLSILVSEPKDFSEELLKKGIVLIESGELKAESDQMASDFTGGEFAGGFHAISRPNPGYTLRGHGKVRLIEAEQLRKVQFDKSILEYFGTDPWIKLQVSPEKRQLSVTPIPSEFLQEWRQDILNLDPQDLRVCSSDWEAIKENLEMILKYYHIDCNKSMLDNRLNRAPRTLCFSLIAEILEHHNLLTKVISWKEDIHHIKFPLLVSYGNRLVTILNQDENTFHCYDGCLGFYKINKNYLISQTPDAAIAITQVLVPQMESEASQAKTRLRTFLLIWGVIKTERKTAIRIGLITLCTYGLGAVSPKLNEILLDEVLKTEDSITLWACLSGLFFAGFFIVVFNFMKNKLITKSSMVLDEILTRYTYAQGQRLSPSSFSRLGTGGIMSRMMEMEKIRSFFSTESLGVVFNIGSAIIYGAMLAGYGASLLIFIISYFLILLVLQYFGRRYLYKINLKEFNLQSMTNSFIGDSISNILPIKAYSAAPSIAQNWESLNAELAESSKKSAMFGIFLDSLIDLIGEVTKIGIIWYCISSLNTPQNTLSFGQVFAIIQLIGQVLGPMGSLVNFLTAFEDMKLSIDKVNEIIFASSSEDDKAQHSVNITGKIKFDRVNFKYLEEGPLILKDISLTIYPGQSVAVVGKSGSGKTTIANLIAKENIPTSGRIYFDDVDSSFINNDEIKSQVGYIQQNNQLFSGSIRSNVAFKDESPDQDRLGVVYELANCDSFIQKFPQKDENYLAEGGMGLSGGQKQRLTMARALYSDPKIMILDEATSALDSESESMIITKLLENKGKVTTIIIAHRLSTIRNADYVYVVDQGQVVQEGTHNDLIIKDGVYKELFQDQAS
jgi:ABC-type bacteriocin/lantibiotic exporter with double-glycine peptidase domain